MKVALCCIGRLENQYSVEYVEHYKKLGFNKIFIYDNNHDGEEHFEDVLQPFIDDGFVEVINYRNKEVAQLSAYNDCYQKHGNEYDWIAFFDFDEFLVLENHTNIGDFLRQFEKYDCLLVNWMIMDDNGLTYNNHLPLMERFTHPMDYDKAITYDFPENNTVKSIVKCGSKIVFKTNPHIPSSKISCCDTLGNGCDSSPFKKYTFKGAYLKHFSTKTIEEWLNVKMKRGYPDGNCDWFKKNDVIGHFFKSNERTDEKLNFIEKHYVYLLGKEQSLDIFICTHKDFEPLVTNKAYKVINSNKINNDTWNGMKGSFYSEIMSYFYIAKNYKLKDYVGFCHYRKYFNFLDNIPNVDETFSQYDCIVAKPIIFKTSIREHYKIFHNIEDLKTIENIIDEKYKEYSDAFKTFFKGKIFIPYNMFIMKKEDFLEYVEFINNVLNDYLDIVGKNIYKRIVDNKDKYLKDFYPNNTIEYQYRIGGYLAERLTNVFMIKKFKKLKTYPVIITENKYETENGKKL